MRGGQLDRHIVIQRATVTQLPSGEPIKTWATLSTRPAMLENLPSTERMASQQLIAKGLVSFVIRWSNTVADVSPLDRIIFPASELLNSPSAPSRRAIYDITAVDLIGRNNRMRLYAFNRDDELN